MQLDSDVLWFTLAISVFAALLFGMMPAIQASASRAIDGIRGGLNLAIANAALPRRRTLRSVLLVMEVALATVIVVGAGLLTRSFANLMSLDTGVRADHTLTMNIEITPTKCLPPCQPAWRSILDSARSLPGVEHAAISWGGPLKGGLSRPGANIQFGDSSPEQPFRGLERPVTPGFFPAAGMRILRGRDFTAGDPDNVVITSEQFARDYFQGDALGKRFRIACGYGCEDKDKDGKPLWLEIVGVVNGTRDRALTQFGSSSVYYRPMIVAASNWQLLARTSGEPSVLAQPLQNLVRSVEKTAIVSKVQTLEQTLTESAALPRFQASVFGAFGLLALILAMIGIFGVTSYSVQQQRHEIGVRMALGARTGQVMGAIIARGAALALGGVACGVALALAFARFVESLLFGVQAVDTATYAEVSAVLLAAALLAFYLPARVAARVDPIQALRHD
jgi:predicted permease